MLPAPKSPQALVPPRVAGRCGPRGGRLRPPRFILHHFRPGVSPRCRLRIPRFRASTKARSLRRSSSPNHDHCIGSWFSLSVLSASFKTASGHFSHRSLAPPLPTATAALGCGLGCAGVPPQRPCVALLAGGGVRAAQPQKGAHGAAWAAARGAVPPRCCLSFLCIKYSFLICFVLSYRSVTGGGVSASRESSS